MALPGILAKSNSADGDCLLPKEAEMESGDPGGFGKMFSDPNLIGTLATNPKTAPLLADPAFVNKVRFSRFVWHVEKAPKRTDRRLFFPFHFFLMSLVGLSPCLVLVWISEQSNRTSALGVLKSTRIPGYRLADLISTRLPPTLRTNCAM